MAGMFEWARERGAEVGNIDVYEFESGRGVRAARDVAVGATLLAIP